MTPDTLTVFNHPSNVVSLGLSHGSGHFHAEVETLRAAAGEAPGRVLQVSQVAAGSVLVAPILNNGLVNLHVFDYCVAAEALPHKIAALSEPDSALDAQILQWAPTTTAKIQVS